jgi:hypothetical protein
LKGLAEWMKGDSIMSPFSNRRCVWYHCTIEKRVKSGKRSRWTNISEELSTQLFCLVDDTGWCIIDPDDAHVVAETDQTRFGQDADSRLQAPAKASWLRLNRGNYRFRERLMRPATPLYAPAEFSSYHNNLTEEFIDGQVEGLVRQWKLQPRRYLAEFDLDQNGKIQKHEWTLVSAAARREVLVRLNRHTDEHHILTKPKDRQHPYI